MRDGEGRRGREERKRGVEEVEGEREGEKGERRRGGGRKGCRETEVEGERGGRREAGEE